MTNPEDPFAPPPAEQPGYGPPPGYPQGPTQYGPPPGWQGGPQTSTKAIIALILAIASFAVCPVIPAIVALVLASSAQQEIAVAGGRLGGDGLVKAAKIISWINLGLALLVVVAVVLLVAVTSSTGTS